VRELSVERMPFSVHAFTVNKWLIM
jgi:hypothetical protein